MRRVTVKMNHILIEAAKHWKYIAPLLAYPKSEREYDLLVDRLDRLLDMVGEDEKHPLIGLVDVLSRLIESYDEDHFKQTKATGISALKHLMKINQLKQSDFPEIGSQGVISELLNGQRKLNLRQVKLLAQRFKVDPSTFIDIK